MCEDINLANQRYVINWAGKSEAYKAGYNTIAETSRELIRRAGKKIQEEIAKEITNLEL